MTLTLADIVLIDDNEEYLRVMEAFLTSLGHSVHAANNYEELVGFIDSGTPDLLMIDIMMPGYSGGHVYELMRRRLGPDLPILVCSASRIRIDHAEDLHLMHMPKPIDFDKLPMVIERLIAGERPPQLG